MTPEQFREMCKAHDLTYSYSDDGGVWRRGQAQRDAITLARKQLGDAIAVPIWNQVVDEKMNPPYNLDFHWTEES